MRASDVAGFETRDSEFGTSNPMPSRPNIKGEYEPKKAAAKAPSSKAAPLSTRGPCLAVALVLLVVVGAAGAAGWYFFLRGGGGGAGDAPVAGIFVVALPCCSAFTIQGCFTRQAAALYKLLYRLPHHSAMSLAPQPAASVFRERYWSGI